MSQKQLSAIDREREKLLACFPQSPAMSHEDRLHWHASLRMDEQLRLAQGSATGEQIQRENSFWTELEASRFRLLNLEEMISQYE